MPEAFKKVRKCADLIAGRAKAAELLVLVLDIYA